MKRKGLIIFDIFMAVVIIFGIIFGARVKSEQVNLVQTSSLAENINRKFEVEATPDYQKKKAGETAEITLSIKNINMGEIGLNNIVGYLSYDEALFDEVNIDGTNDWRFEQNTDKSHPMYGKFVIYTMKDGVKSEQDVVKISLKLKTDLTPQTTEVKLTNLKSSDGNISVDEEDKTAVIEIYDEQTPEPTPTPEPIPEPTPEQQPEPTPEPELVPTQEKQDYSIKTGDSIALIALMLAIATITLNVLVVVKKNDRDENNKKSFCSKINIGIIATSILIAIGLLVFAVTSFAHSQEIEELIQRLDYKESWLNSEKYLVTDDTVSRIAPRTNIGEITDKFNKEIEVYKKDSSERVTDGLVTTGMRITDREYNYEAVVLGDLNEDGESDHIELTRIIRNIVDNEKYSFNNVEKLAADMNVDGSMTMDDVNASIRYILYGELDIPGFDKVIEPKIEVVSGTYNDVIDAYEDTITVKVTAQDEHATKTKYKIEGTSEKSYTVIESGDTFEIANNGVYKVSAYSYGVLGNRSEIPYTILLKKNPNNQYKVITRAENADGTYTETTEEFTDRIGKTVRVGDNIPEGYEINEGESTLEGTIKEDKVIELIVTLDRKEYTLTLNSSEYISSVKIGEEANETTISKSIKFGKTVNISADVKQADGYTTEFYRWQSGNTDVMSDIGDEDASFEMPMSDISFTALANRSNNQDTQYTVEFYYQHDGVYGIEPDSYITRSGETDSIVNVTETDKRATKENYVLDDSKTDAYSGKITGDGKLKLKVYFKHDFTVKYSKGTYGTFETQTYEHLAWNEETPAFDGTPTCIEGYEFNGWNETPAYRVTASKEYVAQWKETEYDITYDLKGGDLGKDDQGKDITNPDKYKISTKTFTLHNPTRAGYRFKGWTGTGLNAETETVTIEQGSTGNRSYEANWEIIDYDIYYELNGGSLGFNEQGERITNPISYNVETPTFILHNPSKVGYTFLGWVGTDLSSETTEVTITKGSTGERSYEAKWRPNTGVEYKVRYYLENLNSTDSSNRDNFTMALEIKKSGITDESVGAEIKEFTGFTFDESNPNNHLEDSVAGDGSLVLEVFYTRNSYTVSLEKDENIDSVTGAGTYRFGQNVNISAIPKIETGYTIEFTKWKSSTADSEKEDHLDDLFDREANFEMPAGNVTLTAISSRAADNVNYTIEFYYEVEGEYPSQVGDENKVVRQAPTNTEVFVTTEDKQTDKDTYVFDDTKNGNLSGIVKGDGSLTLKVYFKQEFKVTYSTDLPGTFETQTTEHLRYNSDTPAFVGEKTHKAGYEFTSWDKTVDDKVKNNIEYIAQWKATEYPITYELNGGTLGEDEEGRPITNPDKYTVESDPIKLHNPTKVGYNFKGWIGTDLSGETEEVIIPQGSTGNRNYEAKWEIIEFDITYNLDGGHLAEGVINKDKYTVETPTFRLNNPSKVGYTFEGWTGTDLTDKTDEVTIAQGSTGNRHYDANWIENTGVPYKVKYYIEKVDSTDKDNKNNYTLKEELNLDGTTNEHVEAVIKSYTGFTYYEDHPDSNIRGQIAGDGSLVLEVYYTRNGYTLTMQKDEHIDTVSGESHDETIGNKVDETTLIGTFKFEETVDIKSTTKNEEGYTITFKEWETESTDILQELTDRKSAETSFIMPADNITVKATSNREANTARYRVEYYYEGENGYPETPTYTDESRSAKVDTEVEVTEADKTPDSRNPGYAFDEDAENNILQARIPVTGTAVLKVFFKKEQYVLNVVAGDKVTEIKLADQTAGEGEALQKTYYYGDSITIDASVGNEDGYTIDFGKWKSSNTSLMADNTTKNLTFTMPAGDLTLTAVANITPLDANYTVEYYYQENGEYPDDPGENNKIIRTGKTGEQASITGADKEPITSGYIYDTSADNVESTDEKGIRADGSTVLKVHFKQQFTVTYLAGEHGAFDNKVIRNQDYGMNIPEYTGNTEGTDGYIFDSWKLTKIGDTVVTDETDIPTTVIDNLEYTAQWIVMPVPEVTHVPTAWTNQNVTVRITAPEGFEDYDIEYSIDDSTEWRVYSQTFEIEQNCTIHARLSADDNKGQAVDHEITNIDKVNPEFAETPTYEIQNNTAIIKANVTDNLSGIVEYGIRKDNYSGYTKYTCENTLATELTFEDAHESGTYEIYIKDAAGNSNTITIEVEIPIHNVARVVSAPAGFEDLIGTEYETLELALNATDNAAQAGNVKIEIIDYIDNEKNTIQSGRDYTINLNNYYIKNQEGKTTLTVDGKLNLVDENKMGEGMVSSPFGVGIYIGLGGELTLGEDENGLPSIFSPIVEGASYGIQKEINYDAEKVYDEKTEKYYYPEGVFNFYDGKVIGGTASFMIQRVNDTPALYDPTVVTNQETGNQESTLAIVSNIEAVIGKKRYMLLEEAVADANNVIGDSNTQVEITIVRDIVKDDNHKVLVDETKNIKLDLNGYTVTTTANDYVIENYGKLEIYDSSESVDEQTGVKVQGTGTITSSTSDTIYNGISAKAIENLDYEEIDLTKAVANGDYYFEARAEGGLISNNGGIANTARSYIEVDLSDKKGMYEVVIDSIISSRANYDYGYVTVKNNTISPEYNNTFGRKVCVSGQLADNVTKFNLAGGEKYYIHFGYRKAAANAYYSDCFIIRSMQIAKIEKAGKLTIQSGTYENTKAGTSNADTGYLAVIKNKSSVIINDGNITASQNYTSAVYNSWNSEAGYVEINGGNINTRNNNIYNQHVGLMKINGATITNTQGNTAVYSKGFLYINGDDVNISGNYSCVGTADGGVTSINRGTYSSSNRAIRNVSEYSRTYIENANISGGSYGVINEGNGYIYINDVNIKSSSYGVYNDSAGTVVIDNIEITDINSSNIPTVQTGIYNDSNGKIIINDGNVICRYKAIQNNNKGYVEINDGTYRVTEKGNAALTMGNYNGNSNAKTVMNNGHIIGMSDSVSLYNQSSFFIVGGILEATQDGAGSIYSNSNYITVTIGDNTDEVSTTNPIIKGRVSTQGATINFYDGVIIGPVNDVIRGTIYDMPDGYELVKEVKEDGLEYITLGIPTYYVARIAASDNPDVSKLDSRYYVLDNGYYKFTTLKSAVEACNETNQTTIELLESDIISRTITISEKQDIVVKLNNHNLLLLASLNFENNGKIKLINEQESDSESITYSVWQSHGGLIIKNNENSTFDMENVSLRYEANQGNSNNYKKIIDNYGILNIKDTAYYIYFNGNYVLYSYGIYNEESGILNAEGLNISGNSNYPIANKGKDIIDDDETIFSTVLKNSTITYSGRPYGVQNDGEGTCLIENSTINSYFYTQNNQTGSLIVKNSTINGGTLYNNSTGYIEIDDSTINTTLYNNSTGYVLIKGNDSSVKYICNRNASGTIEMQAGKVSSSSNGIDNYGILIISGGEVIGSYNAYTSGIRNYSGGVVTISGENTKVTGSGHGIYNEGTVTVQAGIIKGNGNTGIYNTNTLTLGTKDGNVNYNPIVYGKNNGVYNTKAFNFYDGILNGQETASITGTIPAETEEDTIRVIYKGEDHFDDGSEDGYNIASGREISVLEKVMVAYVVSKDRSYPSLQEAYNNTEDTDTIKIIHDVSINGTVESLEIEAGKNITLDLNCFNIVAGNNKTIINNGTLKIIDSTSYEDENGILIEGTFVNGANTILENKGTATIENGSYKLTLGGTSSSYYDMFVNNGTLQINNTGTYQTAGTYSRVLNNVSGTTIIKNTKLLSTASNSIAITNDSGTVTIQDATINGSKYSVNNVGTGTINVESGTYTGQVYNSATGKINISGGIINSQVYNYAGGEINVSGGTITTSSTALYNYAAGTINITGGTITGSSSTIYNTAGGRISIDGSKLTAETPVVINARNGNYAYGVYNNGSGKIEIKGHVLINAATGNNSYVEYGIYNNNTGEIIIGDPDNITNDVIINSTNYGIYNYINANDTIKYYGGKITAPVVIEGYITSIADGYQIIRSTDSSNNEVYEIGQPTGVAKIGSTTYDSLHDAIENAENDKVELLKDIVIDGEQVYTIDSNQEINLDLAGHVVRVHSKDTTFINNGTFKISDSSEDESSRVTGCSTNLIKNYGKLELLSGYIEINQLPNDKVIINEDEGTIKISGGTIKHNAKSHSSTYYNIYDETTRREDTLNSVVIAGGTLRSVAVSGGRYNYDSTMHEVYCVNRQHVEMSGGYIYCSSSSDYTTNGIFMASGGKVDLSGNAKLNIDYNIRMMAGGIINISDNVETEYGYTVYANYTKKDDLVVNVSGGTLKELYGNVYTNCKSILNITGGHCTGTTSYFTDAEIYSGSDVNVNGTAFSNCVDIYVHPGTEMTGNITNPTTVVVEDAIVNGNIDTPKTSVTMDKGEINGSSFGIKLNNANSVANITGGKITASNGPAVLITKGTLTLGINEEGVYPSQSNPELSGSTYGVQNSGGTFNFYDGILTGNTYATSGIVTNTPEMFNVIYKANGTIAILGIEATFEQVAMVNGVYYDDLTSAVAAAVVANAEIELCKDINTTSNIIIPAGSSVSINLCGFSINGYTESGALFTNNGTLVIEDKTNDGYNESTIRNYTGTTIINNGTLVIGTNDSQVYTNAPRIIGTEVAIENNGTWDFLDGQIGKSGDIGSIIVNNGEARKPEGYTVQLVDGVYILVQE